MTSTRMLFVLIPLAAGLALGGCDKAADGGSEGAVTRSTTTSGVTDVERQQQFVACLRERGIEAADAREGQQVELDKNDPATLSALQACREFAPPGSGQEKADVDPEQERQYAACMRSNGLPDFPDPDPDNGLQIPKELVNSARFQQADAECAELLAKPGTGKE